MKVMQGVPYQYTCPLTHLDIEGREVLQHRRDGPGLDCSGDRRERALDDVDEVAAC